MEMIENRMVVYPDLEPDIPEEIREKLDRPGYREMGTGVFVAQEDAFAYALERITDGTDAEKHEFTEWYFSGNWIEEDGSGTD